MQTLKQVVDVEVKRLGKDKKKWLKQAEAWVAEHITEREPVGINADDYDWLVMAIMHHYLEVAKNKPTSSPYWRVTQGTATKADLLLMERAIKRLDNILKGGLSE